MLVRICRLIETAAAEAIRCGQEQIALPLLKDDLVTESLISIADRRTAVSPLDDYHIRAGATTVRTQADSCGTVFFLVAPSCRRELHFPSEAAEWL
jgi:hypothetical protein